MAKTFGKMSQHLEMRGTLTRKGDRSESQAMGVIRVEEVTSSNLSLLRYLIMIMMVLMILMVPP